MFQTVNHPTAHLLVNLQTYSLVDYKEKFLEYTYIYFELLESTLLHAKQFIEDWKTGKKRGRGIYTLPNSFLLMHEDYVLNDEEPKGHEFIKYDSFSFLEKAVEEVHERMYSIQGNLILDRHFCVVQIERIPDGYILPSIIFRSLPIHYSELGDLLRSNNSNLSAIV